MTTRKRRSRPRWKWRAHAREAGDPQQAAQIYAAVVQQDAKNADALGGLADILFEAGQAEQAREVLDRVPEESRNHPAVAAVEAKIALAEQVAATCDPAELEQRLAADPKDHQARFDLAMIQNARGEREAATDNLLAIVKADRGMEGRWRARPSCCSSSRPGTDRRCHALGAAQAVLAALLVS